MKNHSYISMQQDMPDQGQLQVTVLDSASNRPVENATVRISYTGVPDNVIEEIRTDSSGKTPMLELAAPPLEYSMKPVEQQPYAEYTVRISAEGFTPKEVAGTEVLPHSIARQGASLSRQQGTWRGLSADRHRTPYAFWGISSQKSGSRDQADK